MNKITTLFSQALIFLLTTLIIIPLYSQRVIGGKDALEGAYPWMLGLVDAEEDQLDAGFICGGTLIAPNWALTAGHCVAFLTDFGINEIDVFLGTNDIANPNADYERIRVEEIIIHPGFGVGFNDDIALLRLKTPAVAIPLALPLQGDDFLSLTGTACRVLGWGVIDTTYETATYLQEADIEIIDFDSCNSTSIYNGSLNSNMLCAGFTQGTTLTGGAAGDSGGPLIVYDGSQWVEIGIVSFGEKDWTTLAYPGVYQKVSSYRDWIDETINNNPVSTKDLSQQPAGLSIHYTQSSLFIDTEKEIAEGIVYRLFDFTGRLLLTGDMEKGNHWQIDIGHWPIGVYGLNLKSASVEYTHKFIKR